jgi:hypothetical protein
LENGDINRFRSFFAKAVKDRDVKNDMFYRPYIDELLETAKKLSETDIPTLTFSTYKCFDTTGSRKEYEALYFAKRARLAVFASLCMIYGEEYSSQLDDILFAICDEYTWVLPAHFYGRSLDYHYDKPASHRCDVDLFSAETALALAEAVSVCGDYIHPMVKLRVCDEIRSRVLAPFVELGQFFWWETSTNNWSAVCAGSLGGAALYMLDDSRELAPIVQKCVNAMACFLEGFKDDGVCAEGLSYWGYGFGNFVKLAELLLRRTNGAIDLLDNEKVKKIAEFQQNAFLSGNMAISFSDAPLTYNYSVWLTHYLKSVCGIRIPDCGQPIKWDGTGSLTASFRTFAYADSAYTAESSGKIPEEDIHYEQTGWFICKKNADGKPFALAVKAGHNDEPHNQNDVGTFILHYGGVSYLADLGAGEYTKDYFGDKRYDYLVNASFGHNVPIIDGCYQQFGSEYSGKILYCESSEKHSEVSLEFAPAYGLNYLTGLIRNISITKIDGLGIEFVLSDIFTAEHEITVTERFVSMENTVVSDKTVAVGDGLHIEIPEGFTCKVTKSSFSDHSATEKDVWLIDFIKNDKTKEIIFTMRGYIHGKNMA